MATVLALVSAVIGLYLPGLAITWAARLRGLAALALAPALTLAALGIGTVLAGLIDLRWDWSTALTAIILATVCAWLIGRIWPMQAPRALPDWTRRQWLGVGATGLAAVAVAGLSLAAGFGWDLNHPAQRHDLPFHGNLVRFIAETGQASPFQAGLLDHPGKGSAYYPSTVHALVAVLVPGGQVWVALNAMFLVGTVLTWTISVIYLARVLFPNQPVMAVVMAGLSAVFQVTPSTLVYLVPNAVGLALLPALLGWSIQLARVVKVRSSGRLMRAMVLVVALAGASLTHPSVFFSYLVVALPVALYILRVISVRAWRRRWRVGLVLGWAGLVGAIGLAVLAMAALPSVKAALAYETWADPQPWFQALVGGLSDWTSHVVWGPNPVLAALVIGGAVAALRRSRRRWLLMSWQLGLVLYVVAACAWQVLGGVTGLWYGERQRLGVVLTVTALPLATIGLAELLVLLVPSWWGRITRQNIAVMSRGKGKLERSMAAVGMVRAAGRFGRPVAALVTTIGIVVCLAMMSLRPARLASQGLRIETTAGHGRFFDQAEWSMIRRLEGELDHTFAVLGNPTNGSAHLYATNGQAVVFPHLTGQWDSPRLELLNHLNQAPTNPAVCQALRDLNIGYLYIDPETYQDPDAYAALDAAITDLPPTWLHQLDQGGSASLWELTPSACI